MDDDAVRYGGIRYGSTYRLVVVGGTGEDAAVLRRQRSADYITLTRKADPVIEPQRHYDLSSAKHDNSTRNHDAQANAP
ncbi:hypothetical protein VM1G_11324 [Cytospora mali]|uniref:Uncharacterized protein n=1 Tax=Cytospora mali TaxID=578113 RepID=A0A194VM81_CYTMA|nr:hypothetical protein VM1G_11324 [Valsa mali]